MANPVQFTLDTDQMDKEGNAVKEIVLKALLEAGAIKEIIKPKLGE